MKLRLLRRKRSAMAAGSLLALALLWPGFASAQETAGYGDVIPPALLGNAGPRSTTGAGGVSRSEEGESRPRAVRRRESPGRQAVDRTEAGAAASPGVATEGKATPKTVLEREARPALALNAGYQTRFIQHGLDIVGFNSFTAVPDPTLFNFGGTDFSGDVQRLNGKRASSGIAFLDLNVTYGPFKLDLTYVRATDSTVPVSRAVRYFTAVLNAGSAAAGGRPAVRPLLPQSTQYSEFQLQANYTLSLIPNWLKGTVGYNAYFFPERDFRNTHYQGEAFASLSFVRIPYTSISLTYFNLHSDAQLPRIAVSGGTPANFSFGPGGIQNLLNFSNLNFVTRQDGGTYLSGNYFELKAEGEYPILKGPQLSVFLKPYALVSYNLGYATQGNFGILTPASFFNGIFPATPRKNEFNTVEIGLKVPVIIRNRFSVIPAVNYGFDISDSGGLSNAFGSKSRPEERRVWGGVTVAYSF